MKICFYMENYLAGGVDRVIINTINNWPEEDEIILTCNESHEGLDFLLGNITRKYTLVPTKVKAGRELVKKERGSLITKFLLLFWFYLKYPFFLWNVFRLRMFFSSLKPDVVFVHNGGYPGGDITRAAVVAASLSKVHRVFLVVHSLAEKPNILQLPFEFLIDKAIERSSKIIVVSERAKSELFSNRFIKANIEVIYNPVEKRRPLKKAYSKVELGANDREISVAIIGSFAESKGHTYLFEALNILMKKGVLNFKCFVVGSGSNDEIQHLKSVVSNYGLSERVSFLGFMKNIEEYYPAFDVLVFPSISYESCPMVVLEAMSVGIPVIATAVGGVAEIIKDGENGFLLSPKSSDEIAAKLELLLRADSNRSRIGEEARRTISNTFDAKKITMKYYSLAHA